MIDRTIESLIQDVLDGTATPEQVTRLEARLATDADVRRRMRELEGVFQALERVPAVDAPTDLDERVLRALPSRAARASAPSAGFSRFRLATVFVAGVAVGVLGWAIGLGLRSGPAPDGPVQGTMMPARPMGEPARGSWLVGPTTVEAVVRQAGGSRWVELIVKGEPVQVRLDFDARRLAPVAIRQPPAGSEVEVSPGLIQFERAEAGHYAVEWTGNPRREPVHITVRWEGGTAEGDLPLPPAAR